MEIESGGGCGLLVGLASVVVVCLVAGWLVQPIAEGVQDARVSIAHARADQANARADAARERTDAARETNLHRETMFQLWTVALASFRSDAGGVVGLLLGGLGGAVVGLVVVWFAERFVVSGGV